MGNKFSHCFAAGNISGHREDEGLGHSFCYMRPVDAQPPPSADDGGAPFRTISGASISANAATTPSTDSSRAEALDKASAFESSNCFTSIPLQPIPRGSFKSGPIVRTPIERGFLSGPIERRFNSGPLEVPSGPGVAKPAKWGLAGNLKRALSGPFWGVSRDISYTSNSEAASLISDDTGNESFSSQNVQWAQGKAGEDRVHVVISEDHGWVFVGIYDGFNGPDATDFLLNNLYSNIYRELNGLLWYDRREYCCNDLVNHLDVLKAISEALRKAEETFLSITDVMLKENPELAMMGSCVLVMVMKGEDVYLMNVGDSRAVLACAAKRRVAQPADVLHGFEYHNVRHLHAHQLTMDHSTSVSEEVRRIKDEHGDDVHAIANDRVKGTLKVTRAFGVGYLKNPRFNNALLRMFRIDYIGISPYVTCVPFLCHHQLDLWDKFLILSSDGLYQYFTSEEAVVEVETFISTFPEGDPAQHLVEEVLFRAAKNAGMDFHALLDIPHGDRRRYHDDISIIIISFEGRIWHSSSG